MADPSPITKETVPFTFNPKDKSYAQGMWETAASFRLIGHAHFGLSHPHSHPQLPQSSPFTLPFYSTPSTFPTLRQRRSAFEGDIPEMSNGSPPA